MAAQAARIDSLTALRTHARARVQALGEPTQQLEDWRYVRPVGELCTLAIETSGTAQPVQCLQAAAIDEAPSCAVLAGCTPMSAVDSMTPQGDIWIDIDVRSGDVRRVRLQYRAAARVVVTIRIARGGVLELDELCTAEAPVLRHLVANIADDGRLALAAAVQSGPLTRLRSDISLDGAHAEVAIAAAVHARAAHQGHLVTRIHHRAVETRSAQVLACLVRDTAATSVDGLIRMERSAQESDADLQNRNLVLSPNARADSRPQLDIKADRVKAAHGATVGALDPEELLYLRSRGVSEAHAHDLLTRAFLADAASRMADPELRTAAEALLS